jgi:CHAD domain-containing protein
MSHNHQLRPSTRQVRRRVLRRLEDAMAALERVDDPDPDVAAEAVHDVRVGCKEVRSLLRLLRPARNGTRRRVDRWVDEAGSSLGTARDEQVLADTLGGLPVEVNLPRSSGTTPATGAVERAASLLRDARDEVDTWPGGPRSGPVVAGLTTAYRLARRRFTAVTVPDGDGIDDERVHAWRRAVKRLTYQVHAVRPWAPSVLSPYADHLDHLGSLLGDDHDLGNAVARLQQEQAADGTAVAAAIQAARARQAVMRDEALRLGSSLFAETPKAFRRRLRAYVRARRAFGRERQRRGRDDVTL